MRCWSERRELNPRPQAPQTCAIPLRYAPTSLRTLPEVSGNLLTDTTTLRPVPPKYSITQEKLQPLIFDIVQR